MYSVEWDILSKDGTCHMNAYATILNGRIGKAIGSRMVCVLFFGLLTFFWTRILEHCFGEVFSESENLFYKLFLDGIVGSAVLKFGIQRFYVFGHSMDQVV
jgi:hypothetical protein